MVRQTSINSYTHHKKRSKTYREKVYNLLKEKNNLSSREIMHHLNINDPNLIRPELTRLRDKERKIYETGYKICTVTHRKVLMWGVL